MPTYQSETDFPPEPKSRFYPPQGMRSAPSEIVPGTPSSTVQTQPGNSAPNKIKNRCFYPQKKEDDETYFAHRHPISLQRLYAAADSLLLTYPHHGFIYDAYPDNISLQLLRDRLLRENTSLTEDFLQAGCPIDWLNMITDMILSELLLQLRRNHRNPRGEASTTSVQSAVRS